MAISAQVASDSGMGVTRDGVCPLLPSPHLYFNFLTGRSSGEHLIFFINLMPKMYSLCVEIFVNVDFFVQLLPFVLFKQLLQIRKTVSET
jgi:hypothetical protein